MTKREETDRVARDELIRRALDAGFHASIDKALRSSPRVQRRFFEDLSYCDFEWLKAHRKRLMENPVSDISLDICEVVEPQVIDEEMYLNLEKVGKESLSKGEWGVVVFTGGSSTRFYSDGPRVLSLSQRGGPPPKGLVGVTPVTGKSFLEMFASEILAIGISIGRMPPFLMMTSCLTDRAIRSFFEKKKIQGFPKDCLIIFRQGEHPRLDHDGNLIMRPCGALAWTGDGHGGVYKALLRVNEDGVTLKDKLASLGIRHLVMHNVDNALAKPLDFARIGLHVSKGWDFTMSAVKRRSLDEKVGIIFRDKRDQRIRVIEYSVCPKEVSQAGAHDLPLFSLAHINTNLVALDAIRGDIPPTLYTWKVIVIGRKVIASSSYEMLNQHLSDLLEPDRVGVVLLDRSKFFLPTKTRVKEDPLVETTRILANIHRDMLKKVGAIVHDDAVVEIDPCTGLNIEELVSRGIGNGWEIGSKCRIYLGVRLGEKDTPFSEGLTIKDNSLFWVEAENPYGDISVQLPERKVFVDRTKAGRLYVGKGVTVESNVNVRIYIRGNGIVHIPDGARISSDVNVVARNGERIVIR